MGAFASDRSLPTWLPAAALASFLLLAGIAVGAIDVAFSETSPRLAAILLLVTGVPLGWLMLRVSRVERDRVHGAAHPWLVPGMLLLLLAWTAAISWAAEVYFPVSADEYGYTYLADTLLHGRLWNAPPPVPRVLDVNYVYERAGKLFSQYAPGWPAVLAPFRAVDAPGLANPLLTLCLGWLGVLCLRRAGARETTAIALAALLVFSPFVVFNGASRFSHTLTGVMVLLVVWAQMRDEAAPSFGMRALVGFAFSVLLLARYEAFAILFGLFVADRLIERRARFLRDAVAMVCGGLPLALAFLGYNAAITGNPLETPLHWTNLDGPFGLTARGHDVAGGIMTGVMHEVRWTAELFEFAGAAVAALYVVALWSKFRARSLRYYDLLLPAAVAFFFFNMDFGGWQYGPRYWFFGWVTVALTIVTGLAGEGGALRVGRRRIDPVRLAAAHAAFFLGVTLVLAVWMRSYIDARRVVYETLPAMRPALVLIPDRLVGFSLGPWHRFPVRANAYDFPRNGIDLAADVWWGRVETPGDVAIACTLRDRALYRWTAPGVLTPLDCPPNGG